MAYSHHFAKTYLSLQQAGWEYQVAGLVTTKHIASDNMAHR